MRVRVFKDGKRWRADPVELTGMPMNGFGSEPGFAVADLVNKLRMITPGSSDDGYLSQMERFGFPEIQVDEVI